jgi:hypothetical protein
VCNKYAKYIAFLVILAKSFVAGRVFTLLFIPLSSPKLLCKKLLEVYARQRIIKYAQNHDIFYDIKLGCYGLFALEGSDGRAADKRFEKKLAKDG